MIYYGMRQLQDVDRCRSMCTCVVEETTERVQRQAERGWKQSDVFKM